MKKIIIGTLVGTVIYFAFQAIMWEGGFHKDFTLYAAKQDTILKVLDTSLNRDGLYMMPMADVNSPDFKAQQQTIEKQMVGRPWAMVFYHRAMAEFSPAFLIMGIIYTLLSCFLVCCVLYYAGFKSFFTTYDGCLYTD